MASESSAKPRKSKEPHNVYLVPFPKVVFLYPSFLMALVAGAVTLFNLDGGKVNPENTASTMVGLAFLLILASNLVVLGFDFPRATWLTLFFFIVAIVLGLWLVFMQKPEWAGVFSDIVTAVKPVANPTFYFFFASVLGLIYIAVMISVRFNYWEVRGNELLHHRGILSDLVRYPTERLRIEKEIADVFEFMLLGSGNLVLTPRDSPRPIVLENVLMINKKEKALSSLLSTIDVKIDVGDDE